MRELNVLDLFSGAGGFSYALDKVGMNTLAFCEPDPTCQNILRKHFGHIRPIFEDITKLRYKKLEDGRGYLHDSNFKHSRFFTGVPIDIICGGYPCVGHSTAGKKEGLKNEQSKLWKHYLRLIKSIRPQYCIIENSANLRSTGLVEVLKDIRKIGYNAEWSCISGYSVGAPHQRERLYIVLWRENVPYCNPFRPWQADLTKEKTSSWWWAKRRIKRSAVFRQVRNFKSRVLRLDDGVQKKLLQENKEQLGMIGNAIIPQIVELIGQQIMENRLWYKD